MPYRLAHVDRVLFVQWLTPPEAVEIRALLVDVAAVRQRAGTALIGLVLPADDSPPGSDARATFQKSMPTLLESFEEIFVIIAGEGIAASLLRSLVRGMILASSHRGRVHIVASAEAALSASTTKLGSAPAEVMRKLRAEGVLEAQRASGR